jgi:hypothetical protein
MKLVTLGIMHRRNDIAGGTLKRLKGVFVYGSWHASLFSFLYSMFRRVG